MEHRRARGACGSRSHGVLKLMYAGAVTICCLTWTKTSCKEDRTSTSTSCYVPSSAAQFLAT